MVCGMTAAEKSTPNWKIAAVSICSFYNDPQEAPTIITTLLGKELNEEMVFLPKNLKSAWGQLNTLWKKLNVLNFWKLGF